MKNPLEIFEVLNQHHVNYVIIGGHAVNFHGYIRTTEDYDIIINPSWENKEKLLNALNSINACWITNEIDTETGIEKTEPVTESFIRNNHLMMLCTDLGFLDIFDFIPDFPEENVKQIFDTSQTLETLKFISLDWLIKIKQKAGRNRDLEDIKNLVTIQVV